MLSRIFVVVLQFGVSHSPLFSLHCSLCIVDGRNLIHKSQVWMLRQSVSFAGDEVICGSVPNLVKYNKRNGLETYWHLQSANIQTSKTTTWVIDDFGFQWRMFSWNWFFNKKSATCVNHPRTCTLCRCVACFNWHNCATPAMTICLQIHFETREGLVKACWPRQFRCLRPN